MALWQPPVSDGLYHGFEDVDVVPQELYEKYDVKRGLRNADGSGVLVGLTTISNVHGYNKTDHGIEPDDGRLIYRGYDVDQLIDGAQAEDRFGYEEVAYLLISGAFPRARSSTTSVPASTRASSCPRATWASFPRATYSHSIMNVLQRATLLLYAFDPTPDDISPAHEIDVALSPCSAAGRARPPWRTQPTWPSSRTKLVVPPVREGYSMAETVLDVLRSDEGFTHEEAMLLDVMLILHAEHGGGNNSTFTTRVLSSSGTDAYSAYAAAIGSLKGPKHRRRQLQGERHDRGRGRARARLVKRRRGRGLPRQDRRKEAFDKAGLHLRPGARGLHQVRPARPARRRSTRARLPPRRARASGSTSSRASSAWAPRSCATSKRHHGKPICTNIDLYTGFVYSMLGISQDLFTPIFAMARLAGWTAHRMEELYGAGRIIRPAYNSVMPHSGAYVPLDER